MNTSNVINYVQHEEQTEYPNQISSLFQTP